MPARRGRRDTPLGRPPAVLLGGGPIAIPVARSLARHGVRVSALGAPIDPVRRSRACAEFVAVEGVDGVQDRWLEWLEQRRHPGAVVMPCNDDALELTARHRPTLVALGYRLVEADPEVTLAMLDKEATYRLAGRAGVPAPRTVVATDAGAAMAGGIRFPCALKPRHTHHFARHFGLRQKMFRAADAEELRTHMRRLEALGLEMLVTEIVPGPEDAFHSFYGYLDARGDLLAAATKRKLRQFPPHFGLATYHVMTHEPEVAELGLRFLRGAGLRGIGVVEFKRDARDGALKLIECNARLTAGVELVQHAGLDLTRVLYERALGHAVTPAHDYRAGLRMWHPIEDVRTGLALRREGELATRAWLASLRHRQHFPMWSARDPMPTLHSVVGRRAGRLATAAGDRRRGRRRRSR